MRQVPVHIAKSTLSHLIEVTLAGEDVVITRRNKPVVRLVAIPERRFQIGILKGELLGPGPERFTPTDWE